MPDREAEGYQHLTVEALGGAASILSKLGEIDRDLDVYIDGRVEIVSRDGWRIGWATAYEDWWVFIPDYADPEDRDA